jgi:ferredoxin
LIKANANVLRPSTDLQHFMQPIMSFERGYCRPECTRCSEVCPTGAITQKIDIPTELHRIDDFVEHLKQQG